MAFKRLLACVLVLWVGPSGLAENVKVLSFNVQSYNDSTSDSYAALVRIVQALDPDILLLQEAQNTDGRGEFMNEFAWRYPHSFLGDPASDNPRNQILSAYPLMTPFQIFTSDPRPPNPDQPLFERPTIGADIDISPVNEGAELRVYVAHYKSGTASRDRTLRLNQATDDSNDIVAHITGRPEARIYYAGDLNAELGDASIEKLLEPQTTLSRVVIFDLNNGSEVTRPSSGRTIDHLFYSATLNGAVLSPFIFNTATFGAGEVPAPALTNDSTTASDHLCLLATINIPEDAPPPPPPPEPIRINEVLADQDGLDTHEFIELVGPPGASLSSYSVAIIEGDVEAGPGRVDRLWKLAGEVFPPNGLFVLGNTEVITSDRGIGGSGNIENGTETILLLRQETLTLGQDIDGDDDGVAEVQPGTIVDGVALVDDGILTGDRAYYGVIQHGPSGTNVPPGVARVPDGVDHWETLSAFLDGTGSGRTASPGLSNSPGDFDRDDDVDQSDFGTLQRAFSVESVASFDAHTDLDDDGDTDEDDFAIFDGAMTGPAIH